MTADANEKENLNNTEVIYGELRKIYVLYSSLIQAIISLFFMEKFKQLVDEGRVKILKT